MILKFNLKEFFYNLWVLGSMPGTKGRVFEKRALEWCREKNIPVTMLQYSGEYNGMSDHDHRVEVKVRGSNPKYTDNIWIDNIWINSKLEVDENTSLYLYRNRDRLFD